MRQRRYTHGGVGIARRDGGEKRDCRHIKDFKDRKRVEAKEMAERKDVVQKEAML